MKIELEKTAREALARALAKHLADEAELDIGGMDALLLVDFITERMGPHFYNQGLYDARALLSVRLEAMGEALFYELEKPAKF